LYSQIKEVIKLVEQSESIILTTHVVPDGDAIGSVIAFSEYLKLKGKIPIIINHSQTPDNLKFLDKKKAIKVFCQKEDENKNLLENADLIFILDTNEFTRTKSMELFLLNSSAKKICIDHHAGIKPEQYNAIISNTDYCATCQILYEFIKFDDENFLTTEISSALYVGIMTDTGSFRHPRTTSEVFLNCADLINRGADPVSLYEEVYATTTIQNLKLAAKLVDGLVFYNGNKVVIGTVTQEDFNSLGLDIQHVDGFTSTLMNIKGVKIGVILVELQDNIKISFRSKDNIDMSRLAKEFSGGGHKNAAGANVKDSSIPELKKVILKKLENYID